ncbi:PAS domain-containing protein [Aquibacillus koreensis]|uniref:PAS domain-containing protein n=1 Tax=Aquibacillus koreensis TaxID=279446 RepID=A0A9X3WLU2_9BACI|nr:PAS domain-containing protein [Aquibacillus koreensis]MCT2534838.1 PAS domain-containing protein [Aquibacillus koreensis]MDC3419551.1 PAS domain-containing protein [Aquibacillus koreensis]
MEAHLDFKVIDSIKGLLLHIHQEEAEQSIKEGFEQHVQHLDTLDILLILQELNFDTNSFSNEDIKKFFDMYQDIYGQSLLDIDVPTAAHPSHPIYIFKKENQFFESLLVRINDQIKAIDQDLQHPTDQLLLEMKQLGQLYSHYNRKEKLFFPILERYGVFTLPRIMWADDDHIRTLYKGANRMMEKIPDIDFKHVKQAFIDLEKACKDMLFEEAYTLLPVAQSLFNEDNWIAITMESKAFGYAVEVPEESWIPKDKLAEAEEINTEANDTEHVRFGGGFLTIKEANHILNNIPLELTFVDKNGIFKYFNEVVESSEMMFIRTPTSIGRNVGMCHPPKSMGKVMQIIRDLKSRTKESETMWFKKKDQYVHITYKGLFDENEEFLGILEYVQDIQPFMDLPREVKRELS